MSKRHPWKGKDKIVKNPEAGKLTNLQDAVIIAAGNLCNYVGSVKMVSFNRGLADGNVIHVEIRVERGVRPAGTSEH